MLRVMFVLIGFVFVQGINSVQAEMTLSSTSCSTKEYKEFKVKFPKSPMENCYILNAGYYYGLNSKDNEEFKHVMVDYDELQKRKNSMAYLIGNLGSYEDQLKAEKIIKSSKTIEEMHEKLKVFSASSCKNASRKIEDVKAEYIRLQNAHQQMIKAKTCVQGAAAKGSQSSSLTID